MSDYYVVDDGEIIADELTLSEVLEYQRHYDYTLAVYQEPARYKSMWICAPVFVLVFGTVGLALWLVTEAAGI